MFILFYINQMMKHISAFCINFRQPDCLKSSYYKFSFP
nr:MAG TPA: hypothetical protein [Caudoviricetes sp.]